MAEIDDDSFGTKASPRIQRTTVPLSWIFAFAIGKIVSPFDLSWIEIEQAQRGPVTLEGLRNRQELTWTLGSADWGTTSRPNLQGILLSIYREGQDLAKSGKLAEAAARWHEAATRAQQLQNRDVSAWFLFHSAESFAGANMWKVILRQVLPLQFGRIQDG